jgi:hypothetical protein
MVEGHKGLSRFGPQECVIPYNVIPYILCLLIVLLGNLIGLVLEGRPCRPYISLGVGLLNM